MDQPLNAPPPMPGPAYPDRTVLLIIFGFIQAGMGGLCLLVAGGMVWLQIYASTLPNAAFQQMQSTVAPPIIYGMMGSCLIGLGVGSIMARRWARALTLTLSSTFLVIGAFSMISMLIVFSSGAINLQPPGQEGMPAGVMAGMFAMMFAHPSRRNCTMS